MGAIFADVHLANQADLTLVDAGHRRAEDVRRETVRVLVDTGATTLVITESLAACLGLAVVGRKLIGLADGSVKHCDVVGPIEIRYENRWMIGTAIAMPDPAQPLFGAIQMEDMDLVPDPVAQRLIVNPESPDRARLLAVSSWPRVPLEEPLPPVP